MKQCCPLLSREPLTSECCRTFSCKQLDLPCYKDDLFCIRSSRCHDACTQYRYRPTACDIGPPWKDRMERKSLLSNSVRTTSPKSESVLLGPSYWLDCCRRSRRNPHSHPQTALDPRSRTCRCSGRSTAHGKS